MNTGVLLIENDARNFIDYEEYNEEAQQTNKFSKKSHNIKSAIKHFLVSPYNISIEITFILLCIIGLSIGLSTFFSINAKEQNNLRIQLDITASVVHERISAVIFDAIRVTKILSALVLVRNGTINYYSEFKPFMEKGEIFVKGVAGLQLVSAVTNSERNSFIEETRKMGGLYKDFKFLDLNTKTNHLVPSAVHEEYFVIIHSAPISVSENILGFNVNSSPTESQQVNHCKKTGNDSATEAFTLVENVRGFVYYSPIYNSLQSMVGLCTGVFHVLPLINQAVDEAVVVTILDSNLTSSNANQIIYYNGVSELSLLDPSKVRRHLESTSSMQYKDSIFLADRRWDVYYAPSPSLIVRFDDYEKWIVLGVSIIVSLFVEFVIVIFIKRIEHNHLLNKLSVDRVNILQETQTKLNHYLERIANKEKESRLILDTIPDFIAIVDDFGEITSANLSFIENVHVTTLANEDYSLNIKSFFPDLKEFFFQEVAFIEQIRMRKINGTFVPVSILVKRMHEQKQYLLVIRSLVEQE
ncbi:hypothetical protein AKO1_008420 [Acrasis kona]|uniref:CHASE domain-containing protein n=1 Tax=Acrasis kona TaxID=1008807 RepID=A0AAW2YNB3_9EUKA